MENSQLQIESSRVMSELAQVLLEEEQQYEKATQSILQ